MGQERDLNFYRQFCECSVSELEQKLLVAKDPDEKAFYRTLLNLKLQISQGHIVGKALV